MSRVSEPVCSEIEEVVLKPKKREVIVVTQIGDSEQEITGMQIVHCESRGSWHVPTKR